MTSLNAQTPGLNSKGGFLGSELKDRGDRIAFLGDAHVAQMTALVAFGNYKMLNNSNYYTATIGRLFNATLPLTLAITLPTLLRLSLACNPTTRTPAICTHPTQTPNPHPNSHTATVNNSIQPYWF
jgi:hypothetical protein